MSNERVGGISADLRAVSCDDQLIARHITFRDRYDDLDDARLAECGAPVWVIIDYLNAEQGDIARVAAAYRTSEAEVEAALAYYRRHKPLIDARIEAQIRFFTE
jgi:uncharacterized protein (DUF433 family)